MYESFKLVSSYKLQGNLGRNYKFLNSNFPSIIHTELAYGDKSYYYSSCIGENVPRVFVENNNSLISSSRIYYDFNLVQFIDTDCRDLACLFIGGQLVAVYKKYYNESELKDMKLSLTKKDIVDYFKKNIIPKELEDYYSYRVEGLPNQGCPSHMN